MEKEKIYNYFYIVNNLLNGRFYLGVHSTDTLADGYMGSGKLIKRAIKKHGKEHFELTPLKFFKTRKELMEFEKEIVNPEFLEYYKGICYNVHPGGDGGSEKKFTAEEIKQRERDYHSNYYVTNIESRKEYNDKNKEQKRIYNQNWYKENKDHKREYDKQHNREYYQRPEVKERRKKYYRDHRLKNKNITSCKQAY